MVQGKHFLFVEGDVFCIWNVSSQFSSLLMWVCHLYGAKVENNFLIV